MAGPSSPLTPFFDRRTVYGKVSRYKLDEFLQLFDFPSPNLSAEKRFTTSVPLQRLFFMNSDFMQQQGELLARRIAVPHPRGGIIDVSAPLPPHMEQSWNLLGFDAKRYDPIEDAPEE